MRHVRRALCSAMCLNVLFSVKKISIKKQLVSSTAWPIISSHLQAHGGRRLQNAEVQKKKGCSCCAKWESRLLWIFLRPSFVSLCLSEDPPIMPSGNTDIFFQCGATPGTWVREAGPWWFHREKGEGTALVSWRSIWKKKCYDSENHASLEWCGTRSAVAAGTLIDKCSVGKLLKSLLDRHSVFSSWCLPAQPTWFNQETPPSVAAVAITCSFQTALHWVVSGNLLVTAFF